MFGNLGIHCFEGEDSFGIPIVADHDACPRVELPPPGVLGGWYCTCECHAEEREILAVPEDFDDD
jgi:hypothetical protein